MSKIKVDEIESSSSKVELAPKGSGLVKVKGAGGGDGTLQMTSSGGNNAVKIKSPNHAAGRQDTLILPDNNIGTDGFLRVKSVTGSGATAVGQLEFKVFPTIDRNNLDASTFTTNTIPSANMPAATAAQGAGLQFVSKTTVATNNTIRQIEIDLDNDTDYLLLGKKLSVDNGNTSYPNFSVFTQLGTQMTMDYFTSYSYNNYAGYHMHSTGSNTISFAINGVTAEDFTFTMEIRNRVFQNHFFLEMGLANSSQPNMRFIYGGLSAANSSNYIERLRFWNHPSYSHFFRTSTELILYKYLQ